jgi:hypothetical protein
MKRVNLTRHATRNSRRDSCHARSTDCTRHAAIEAVPPQMPCLLAVTHALPAPHPATWPPAPSLQAPQQCRRGLPAQEGRRSRSGAGGRQRSRLSRAVHQTRCADACRVAWGVPAREGKGCGGQGSKAAAPQAHAHTCGSQRAGRGGRRGGVGWAGVGTKDQRATQAREHAAHVDKCPSVHSTSDRAHGTRTPV